ncbi:MAG: efflux RND transporter periplasmic adaptor subunit [Terracidiphilus sp.]
MGRSRLKSTLVAGSLALLSLAAAGCGKKQPAAAGAAFQAMPVGVAVVNMAPVAQSDEYMATIKSRRSATISPQVSGVLTEILVHSGEQVKSGQALMQIDPRQQQANVASLLATERQKKALYDYNAIEIDRQKKLFDAGIISHDAYQQEEQTYANAKADYESAVEAQKTQQQLLDYYTVRAPYSGIVGDVPVHVGDYVATGGTPTILTTVDENRDLEAYIYIPTARAAEIRLGLEVDLLSNSGAPIEKTNIDFISPQVDDTLQGILVKAPVRPSQTLRNEQTLEARVVWSKKPMALVPVLAVTRLGGQAFVFVAEKHGGKYVASQRPITVGEAVGSDYAVVSGLENGDKVIVSGTQLLRDGAPVIPLPARPPAQSPAAAGN